MSTEAPPPSFAKGMNRNAPLWVALAIAVVIVGLNHQAVRFAFLNLPGLLGYGGFGALEERRLGQEGRTLARQGELAGAIWAFEASLAIDPRGEFRRDLALALFESKAPERAEAELRRHLESFPRDGSAHLALALLLQLRAAPLEEVRTALLAAREGTEADLTELKVPVGDYPAEAEEKRRRRVAELERTRAGIEEELARLLPALGAE